MLTRGIVFAWSFAYIHSHILYGYHTYYVLLFAILSLFYARNMVYAVHYYVRTILIIIASMAGAYYIYVCICM